MKPGKRRTRRRKAKKRGKIQNRLIAADVHRPIRDRAACPTPGKVCYATKNHAKQAARRALPQHAASSKEHNLALRPEAARGSLPRAYRCRCGAWHLGHLRKSIRSGPEHRDTLAAA